VNRTGIVVLTEDAPVIAALVRVGCAATAAMGAAGAVEQMRKNRALRIGRAFLDELDPDEETA
jgi:ABC-type transporter Mla maintaining outer membrane lipid asymmetry permease subunit MlaE